MAATTGFRTFYPALIPPGSKHVNGVHSAGPIEAVTHVFSGAAASSLLGDFYVRAAGIANLYGQVFESLPMPAKLEEYNHVAQTYLRLNCLTVEYAELWERITGTEWTPDTPILNALQRQKAQVRIDVSVANMLHISEEELRMIYRTQFPVLRKYDLVDKFDRNGRLVPKDVLKSGENNLAEDERPTWVHPQSGREYILEPPFKSFDRESEIGCAYARLAKES